MQNFIPVVLFIILQTMLSLGLYFIGKDQGNDYATNVKDEWSFSFTETTGIKRTVEYRKIKEILEEFYKNKKKP